MTRLATIAYIARIRVSLYELELPGQGAGERGRSEQGRDLFMNYVIDLDTALQVLRVTLRGTVADEAFREVYASIGHCAATGGPMP